MALVSNVRLQLAAAVANGICQSQAPAAAGNLNLNGTLVSAGVATLDTARRILVTSDGNDSAATFTIYGTNRDGVAQQEAITGLNATSKYTALDFKTVTRIAIDRAAVGNITAGTNGTGSSVWVMDNPGSRTFQLSVAVYVDPDLGAVTYTVEHTYDDPNKIGVTYDPPPQNSSIAPGGFVPPIAWPNSTLRDQTASGEAVYNNPIQYHRVTITAGTGRVTMQSLQAEFGTT